MFGIRIDLLCLTAIVLIAGLGVSAQAADTILEDCVIEPNKVAEVSSPVDGIIDKLAVKRGQLVKTRQVVAILKSSIEKATVELARVRSERDQAIKARRARLEFTQRRLKRNQELFAQNLISEQVVDEAETDVLLAELELGEFLEERMIAILELERAEEALEIRTIRSPFSGVVVDVLVASGESIENRPLFRIASIDPLNVELIAPVQLFGKIKKGAKATVIPEQPIGGKYKARVAIVDRVLDAASGTFGIRLQLSNKKYKLPAGLRCTVIFEGLAPATSEKGTEDSGSGEVDRNLQSKAAEGDQPGESKAADGGDKSGQTYTVYLFSTRSEDVARQVNERFNNEGYATAIITSDNESLTRYRIGVAGFDTLSAAQEFSDSVVGKLDISKTWIGKDARNN